MWRGVFFNMKAAGSFISSMISLWSAFEMRHDIKPGECISHAVVLSGLGQIRYPHDYAKRVFQSRVLGLGASGRALTLTLEGAILHWMGAPFKQERGEWCIDWLRVSKNRALEAEISGIQSDLIRVMDLASACVCGLPYHKAIGSRSISPDDISAKLYQISRKTNERKTRRSKKISDDSRGARYPVKNRRKDR